MTHSPDQSLAVNRCWACSNPTRDPESPEQYPTLCTASTYMMENPFTLATLCPGFTPKDGLTTREAYPYLQPAPEPQAQSSTARQGLLGGCNYLTERFAERFMGNRAR